MSQEKLQPPPSLAGLENTVFNTLDIEVLEASPERVIITMPVSPKVHQPFGLLHGGVSVLLAESVASFGAFLSIEDPSKQTAVGQEINANHLRSVRSGTVTATGTPIHKGKRSQVWHIEIHDQEKRLICISRCTLAIIDIV